MSGMRGDRGRSRAIPYVGGRPFGSADRELFFGRRAESDSVLALWLSRRLVVLHGLGATGKTSLVQCGVLPRVAGVARADLLPPVRLTTSGHPSAGQSDFGNCYPNIHALLDAWDTADNGRPHGSLVDVIAARSRARHREGEPTSIFAVIDQAEKIFVQPKGEPEILMRALASALDAVPALRVLLVADDQVTSRIEEMAARLGIPDTAYYRLGPLSRAAAVDAVTGPLQLTGLALAPGTAEQMVDSIVAGSRAVLKRSAEVPGNSVEPLLLQLMASEFWSSGSWDRDLVSAADVVELGDVGKAFRYFYDSVVASAHAESGQPESAIRGWVEKTFVDRRERRKFARRGRALTRGMPDDVIEALVSVHFLLTEQRSGTEWCGLRYAGQVGAVVEVNDMWRAVAGKEVLEQSLDWSAPQSLFEAARDALSEGDAATAQNFAGLAIERYRRAGDERSIGHALLLRGDIACSLGDLGSAEENFQGALSRFAVLQDRNLAARTLSALGEVQMLAGDYRKAAEFHQLAVDQVPTYVGALVGLGYAQWYGGSPADAEASFSQALTWDSKSAVALGRGQVRAEMHEYVAALRDIDKALQIGLSPDVEVDVLSARGLALAGLDRRDEAENALAVARIGSPGRRGRCFAPRECRPCLADSRRPP